MGETNKLLLPIDHIPLIRHCADVYCSLGMPVTAVLGHEADRVQLALDGLPINFVTNPTHTTGKQSSIRLGLDNYSPSEAGLFIALGDQPLLEPSDIKSFCDVFLKGKRDKIMIPCHNQVRGNPVLFPPELALRIRSSHTPTTPRSFIDTNPELSEIYAAPNAHFTTDLDTPADVENWTRSARRKQPE